ncbi:hypothetical protein ACFX12_019426 [Malus domestica]
MRYFMSLTSDADLSSSCPVAMQVMTAGATSIEEQLAQMSEAIARLTRTVEENDLQIATLINRLEVQHDDKADPKVDPSNEETNKKEEPLVEKAEEKLDQAITLMGSLFIQYQGSSHDSMQYLKPYSKNIDALRMRRGY